MDYKIIPSILEKDKQKFLRRLNKIMKISKNIQIDIMDGEFVKQKSISLSQLPDLRKKKDYFFEAHLMVTNPRDLIDKLSEKGFKKVLFHYEAHPSEWDIVTTIKHINAENMMPVLVINPNTEINKVLPFIHKEDTVMVMGAIPGKEHQEFNPEVYEKIRQLRRFSPSLNIQVDGGANNKTIKKLIEAGANLICSGSYISLSRNPKNAMAELEKFFPKKKKKPLSR